MNPTLLEACKAVLVFHSGGPWHEVAYLWPGCVPATTKGLCDYVRAAIRDAAEEQSYADLAASGGIVDAP